MPRGGKSLVARVQSEARVPVFAHLEGVCHVYVDKAATLDMAKTIVMNAKMRRTGVCGAAETLLVDRAAASTHLKPLIEMLLDAGCEVRGDAAVQKTDARVKPASEADWATEYLDTIITAGVVDGVDAAIEHIERYGTHHTDAIVTADKATAEKFLNEVDSAIVLHNASTQFADGGEFGFGAEIGIATGKLHARGPVGVEQLDELQVSRPRHGADQAVTSPPRLVLPPHAPGLRIGLFGGTFDPPHAAHLGASLLAMKRLKLDRMWWLVTPGNPLKDTRGLRPLDAAHGRSAETGQPPPHRRHRSRSCHQHPLHLRHPGISGAPLPGGAIRLGHGRRQSAELLPLAKLAPHRESAPHGGGRPHGIEPLRHRRPGIPGARALPPSGISGVELAEPEAAGLGLSPRTEIPSVLNRAPRAPEIRRKRLNTGG